MEEILITDYALCFIGWLITEGIFFSNEKDKYDEKGKRFFPKNYFKKRYDNAIISLIIAIALLLGGSGKIFESLNIGYIFGHLSLPLAYGISGWAIAEFLKDLFKKIKS